MTSSNKPLSYFLETQDFLKLEEEMRAQKQEAQRQALKEAKQREEEQRQLEQQKLLSQADIDKADRIGYERGLAEGAQQTKEKLTKEFEHHINDLLAHTKSHEEISRKYLSLLKKDAVETTSILLNYILGDIAQRYPNEMLKLSIERALNRVDKKMELTIYIHPASQIYMADMKKSTLKDYPFKIVEDESINEGQCRIEWENHGQDSSVEGIHSDIQELLDGYRQGIHPSKVELPPLEQEEPNELDKATEASLNEEEVKNEEIDDVAANAVEEALAEEK